MKKFSKLFLLAVGAIFLTFSLSACGNQSSTKKTSADKIKVAATTNFYGNIAQEVLGNHGTVTSIIDSPNVDPHDFTPTTATAKKVAKANLVIENGVGYDTWVNKLQARKILSVGKIVGAKDGDNEHLWYNPANIEKYVDALAAQYGRLLPQDAAIFKKNAAAYKKKLNVLNQKMDQIKNEKQNADVAVSEPVFNYALQKMGFKVTDNHFALAIEEGSDPSYTDIRDLQNSIKEHKIAFFVLNKQDDSKIVDNIADLCRKENIPVLEVTETMPKGGNYIDWFSNELDQLAKIVQTKR